MLAVSELHLQPAVFHTLPPITLNLQDRLIDKWKFPVFRAYCRAKNVVCSQLKERCEDFCKQGPLVVSLLLQVEITGSQSGVSLLASQVHLSSRESLDGQELIQS